MIGYNWVRDDLSFRDGRGGRVVLHAPAISLIYYHSEYSEFGKCCCKSENIIVV